MPDPRSSRTFQILHATCTRRSWPAAWPPARPALYNSLYIFSPNGGYSVYDKRQLVPFAEWFPGRAVSFVASLRWCAQRGSRTRQNRRRLSNERACHRAADLLGVGFRGSRVRAGAARRTAPRRQHRRRLVRHDLRTLHARADRAASRHRDGRLRRAGCGNRNKRHHRAGRTLASAKPAATAGDRHGPRWTSRPTRSFRESVRRRSRFFWPCFT